jgi:hypothetical protein
LIQFTLFNRPFVLSKDVTLHNPSGMQRRLA